MSYILLKKFCSVKETVCMSLRVYAGWPLPCCHITGDLEHRIVNVLVRG